MLRIRVEPYTVSFIYCRDEHRCGDIIFDHPYYGEAAIEVIVSSDGFIDFRPFGSYYEFEQSLRDRGASLEQINIINDHVESYSRSLERGVNLFREFVEGD